MQELQKIVESQIETINNNFPSIYNKTDVLAIINIIIINNSLYYKKTK